MAGTRTFKGTLDKLQFSAGSTELAYLGPTAANNVGDLVRGFSITPGNGDIILKIDKSAALLDIRIFQQDSFAGSATSPTGYLKYCNIAKAGKGKGAIGVTATSGKVYVVLLTFDDYTEASYIGSVVVP